MAALLLWLALMLAAAPLRLAGAPAAADIYVSPAGSDGTGDGTQAKPFATLPKAQLAARKALDAITAGTADGTAAGNVTVHLGPGKYFAREPLVLTALDSGRNGGRMRWAGPGPAAGIDPAKAAVVHGGVAVPPAGWHRSAPGSPVWRVNVSALAPPPSSRRGRPLPPPPSPSPPPPPPPPVENATYSHCGAVEVGVAYNGADISPMMAGSIDKCCQACGANPKCKAWSFCNLSPGLQCGTAAKPVDCYLKTSAAHPSPSVQRVSGSPGTGCRPHYGPPSPPPPTDNWRFFNLLEGGEGAVLARLPDFGSGCKYCMILARLCLRLIDIFGVTRC